MISQIRTFRCPNCNEVINESMTQCRYCSVAIDPGIAAQVAEKQEKTNQACSDASFLRTAAVAMFVFLGLSLVPFIASLTYYAFLGTFVVTTVLFIVWQVRFGTLITNDPDYQKAKRSRNLVAVLLIVAVPLGFIVRPLMSVILSWLMGVELPG